MSLKLVPFESLGAVSYSPSIVTVLWLYLYPFVRYSVSKNGVSLTTRLGVVHGHRKWRRSIDHMRLSIGRPL